MSIKIKVRHSCAKVENIRYAGICVENFLYFRVTSPILNRNPKFFSQDPIFKCQHNMIFL